ncbi:hypothetical protein C8A01DRAFT_33545 [Parachaetomium inaequale]|uniref:PEX11 domain protein n=1 Tax=Parachaetomium inaequale TaxID=2588326 RepID=A0AAN6PKG2_9PEZI|nr:hypothetical protein C8A01DRAFT_33545 [Parachaetomium inaequale]
MADRVSTFEQFVKFGTDAYGIERLLRLLQSLTTLLLFTPTLLTSFLPLSSPLTTLTPSTLTHLRTRLATLRQPLRFFRFLDSFSAAWSVLSSLQQSSHHHDHHHKNKRDWPDRLQQWLDFGSKAFTGMYLLLESLVFIEVVLDAPGLGVWASREVVVGLVVDGQRFWFAGLVCGVLGGVVKLMRDGLEEGKREKGGKRGKGKVVRRLVADVMDLGLPGSVVGWVPLVPGTVGLLMLGSTVLTGLEVWERCGREVVAAKKAAREGR